MLPVLRKLLTELSILYTVILTILFIVLGGALLLQPSRAEQGMGVVLIVLGGFFLHYQLETTERVGD